MYPKLIVTQMNLSEEDGQYLFRYHLLQEGERPVVKQDRAKAVQIFMSPEETGTDEHVFFLDFSNMTAVPEDLSDSPVFHFADAVINGYVELSEREGDFVYDGDLSKFLLTNAQRFGVNHRFYRNDGIIAYQILKTLTTLLRNDNLVVSVVAPAPKSRGEVVQVTAVKT